MYTDPAREDSRTCVYQNITEAQQEAYQFLRDNVMPFDRPFLETMGFHDNQNEDPDTQPLPDGLDQGMIGQTILYALKAKQEFPNTDALPKRIWQEYILNYANANEARTNWRPLLYEKLRHLVTPQMNVSNVVRTVNKQMWKILAPKGHDAIVFKSGSTPLIFDPMSILAFGYVSPRQKKIIVSFRHAVTLTLSLTLCFIRTHLHRGRPVALVSPYYSSMLCGPSVYRRAWWVPPLGSKTRPRETTIG